MDLLKDYEIDFSGSKLIDTALTHTSYSNEHKVESYERLEYLGDAVLELVFSDYVFNHTHEEPGEMSRMRSLYVCENALYEYAKKVDLIKYIKVGNGIKEPNETITSDVFEAVIGVIYLEHGINEVKKLFNKVVVPFIEEHADFLKDYKSLLQETVQTEKKSLIYTVIEEKGPSHNKFFKVNVLVEGMIYGTGSGKSKKEAEQNAAKDAFRKNAR